MTDRSTGILANPPINQQTDIIVHGDWGSLTSNDKVTLAHWDKAICGLGGGVGNLQWNWNWNVPSQCPVCVVPQIF